MAQFALTREQQECALRSTLKSLETRRAKELEREKETAQILKIKAGLMLMHVGTFFSWCARLVLLISYLYEVQRKFHYVGPVVGQVLNNNWADQGGWTKIWQLLTSGFERECLYQLFVVLSLLPLRNLSILMPAVSLVTRVWIFGEFSISSTVLIPMQSMWPGPPLMEWLCASVAAYEHVNIFAISTVGFVALLIYILVAGDAGEVISSIISSVFQLCLMAMVTSESVDLSTGKQRYIGTITVMEIRAHVVCILFVLISVARSRHILTLAWVEVWKWCCVIRGHMNMYSTALDAQSISSWIQSIQSCSTRNSENPTASTTGESVVYSKQELLNLYGPLMREGSPDPALNGLLQDLSGARDGDPVVQELGATLSSLKVPLKMTKSLGGTSSSSLSKTNGPISSTYAGQQLVIPQQTVLIPRQKLIAKEGKTSGYDSVGLKAARAIVGIHFDVAQVGVGYRQSNVIVAPRHLWDFCAKTATPGSPVRVSRDGEMYETTVQSVVEIPNCTDDAYVLLTVPNMLQGSLVSLKPSKNTTALKAYIFSSVKGEIAVTATNLHPTEIGMIHDGNTGNGYSGSPIVDKDGKVILVHMGFLTGSTVNYGEPPPSESTNVETNDAALKAQLYEENTILARRLEEVERILYAFQTGKENVAAPKRPVSGIPETENDCVLPPEHRPKVIPARKQEGMIHNDDDEYETYHQEAGGRIFKTRHLKKKTPRNLTAMRRDEGFKAFSNENYEELLKEYGRENLGKMADRIYYDRRSPEGVRPEQAAEGTSTVVEQVATTEVRVEPLVEVNIEEIVAKVAAGLSQKIKEGIQEAAVSSKELYNTDSSNSKNCVAGQAAPAPARDESSERRQTKSKKKQPNTQQANTGLSDQTMVKVLA